MPQNFKPETWKDILKKNQQESKSYLKHNWIIAGSGGGSSNSRMSFSGSDKPDVPRYLKYKCTKCGITATKSIGEDFKIDDEYSGLSCDEAIIKDIIE